jgi:Tol biopolymer transport system component
VRTLIVSASAVVVTGAACTSSAPTTADHGLGPVSASPQPLSGASLASPPPSASSLPGTILFRDLLFGLGTVRPDGSGRTSLSVGRPGGVEVVSAAWSPDGRHIAWSQIDDNSTAATPGTVVTTDRAGDHRVDTTMPLVPFYLSWDPTSSRIAYLGSGSGAIRMGVVDVNAPKGSRVDLLDTGQPYYFSWAPLGDRLAVHVGERLDELRLDGSTDTIGARPGLFQTPVWSADGSSLVYVRRTGTESGQLVVRDLASNREQVLADLKGTVLLAPSPDGERVAFQALGPGRIDFYDRSLPQHLTDVGVTVVDVATGEVTRVSRDIAMAWSWSPDGDQLAILEPMYQGPGPILFQWRLWDGAGTYATDPFTASISLLTDYAPFFGQFAESSTMWAPDGSAFAFSADLPSGPSQIVVQPAKRGVQPFVVGEGSFLGWSPTR